MKTIEELDITPSPWRVITVNGKLEAVESCLGIESPTVCNANRMKKADARLIAAAPKMYEKAYSVLDNLLTHLHWPEETIRMNRAEVAAMAKELQDALAEASGEVSNG